MSVEVGGKIGDWHLSIVLQVSPLALAVRLWFGRQGSLWWGGLGDKLTNPHIQIGLTTCVIFYRYVLENRLCIRGLVLSDGPRILCSILMRMLGLLS